MKGITKRLICLREQRYKTATDAARAIGVPVPTYSGHENGSRGITLEAAERYARFFKVTLDWLASGRGDPKGGPTSTTEVPRLSWVSAGALRPHVPIDDLNSWPTIEVSGLPDGDWIALEVEGDSMDRISPPGSLIFVNRRDQRLVPNACYVIADEQGEATYKRYRPNPDRFEPVSVNPIHEPIYPDNDPIIIGRVKRSAIDM